MLCGNYILSNRSEWTFYFLSSVQFNFTIGEKQKKLMHQRLSNNDVSVFYLNYFSNALSSIRMIVRSSRNYVNS